MTITLPDEMRAMLELNATAAGFGSVDEYVIDALTDDYEPHPTRPPDFRTRAELEKLLDEGMASGPPVPCDAAFWARLEAVVRNAEAKQRRASA